MEIVSNHNVLAWLCGNDCHIPNPCVVCGFPCGSAVLNDRPAVIPTRFRFYNKQICIIKNSGKFVHSASGSYIIIKVFVHKRLMSWKIGQSCLRKSCDSLWR